MFSRNNIGQGSLFCGYRFSLMNDRLFNYINYTGGDCRKFFYEINYMPYDDTLFDYIYKRKIDEDYVPVLDDIGTLEEGMSTPIKNKQHPNFVNFKHSFRIHKMLIGKSNRVSLGITKNNKTFLLNLSQKHKFFMENSIRTSLKFSSDSFNLKNKIKHKINENFFTEVIKL